MFDDDCCEQMVDNSNAEMADRYREPVDLTQPGADLLELALRRQYDTSEAALLATAKAINRRKGLPRTR